MADNSAEKTLQKLEQEITCPVCHNHFRDPKILPCLHYYCKECVQALADRAGPNQPFPCPECRADTSLPQNGPNQLPTAFFMNRLKELHSLMETADRKVEAVCQQCSGGNSEGFCRHCAEFICGDCMKVHKKMKAFASHEVLTLDELKEGGAKKIVAKLPPRMCSDHDEQKKLYCFDCDRLICRDCTMIDHNGHNYGFVKKATPRYREELVKQMTPLKATRKSYSDATDRAKAMISEIETQNTENIGAINRWIQEWMEIIQRYGHRLIEDISDLVKQKIENLKIRIKGFESASAVIQSLEEFCEQNLENATDEEFIEIHKQILSRVEDESRKHKDANFELAEEATTQAQCGTEEDLIGFCQRKALYVEVPVASVVGKQSRVTFNSAALAGKQPQAVEGELKSLFDGSVVHIKGTQKKEGMYEMVYTPQIRGRHQLAVTVNGEQVAGSPFAMCVKIPPTQLGTPVGVISGLSRPFGVAFNSAEEVLVATTAGGIQVFDKHGKKLRRIKRAILIPKGIAVDKEDNIFVVDSAHSHVYKLDKDGKQLKVIKASFNHPGSVAVIGEQVLVSDTYNHRIHVFNRELEFVKFIGSRGTGNGQFQYVHSVSQDDIGNLYVCDCDSHRIQVLNGKGEFLYSFGTEGEGEGQLFFPCGVCVSDQLVYISDWYRVSVFDKNGHFVSSFGAKGSAEGCFSNPYIIAVDRDGFVYVSDYDNNRVQIF